MSKAIGTSIVKIILQSTVALVLFAGLSALAAGQELSDDLFSSATQKMVQQYVAQQDLDEAMQEGFNAFKAEARFDYVKPNRHLYKSQGVAMSNEQASWPFMSVQLQEGKVDLTVGTEY